MAPLDMGRFPGLGSETVVSSVVGAIAPTLPSAASSSPANPLQGLSHLMSLAERRDRFWGPQVKRLREKMTDIVRRDPASAASIAEEALRIRQPNAVRLKYLIWAVHKTHTRLTRWPAGVGREGPLAAFYIRRRNDAEGRDALQRQLIQPSTLKIAFDAATGSFAVTDRPFSSKIDPMAMIREDDEAAVNLTPELFRGLEVVFATIRDLGLVDARRDYANLCRRLGILLRYDSKSLSAWLAAFVAEKKAGRMDAAGWKRFRRGLYAASDFVDGWRGRVSWTGDPIAYFLANGHDLKKLRKLYHAVEKGTVKSLRFDGAEAHLETMFPVRRSHTMAVTGYSYRDAVHARFLPGPSNGWGARDFAQSEERLAERIQGLFETIEKRQDLTPAVIQRTLKIPYYSIRTARTGMAPAYMEDRVLDRLEMTEAEKEKLRHLQTLLAIARDRRKDVESGPYREQGRLLWYYRWLHQIHQRTMQELYRDGVAQEGATEIELGRARLSDRNKVATIAEALGVPSGIRQEFVEEILSGYERVRRKVDGDADDRFTSFPNEAWAVPFAGVSDDDLESAFLALRKPLAAKWTRADMTKISGLEPHRAHALSLHGTLWAVAMEDVLIRAGSVEEARQLRVMRAALELRRKPVEDRAGFHRAGRLLRFVRLMMPGWAAEDVISELKLDLRTPAYTYWEWGFTRMPEDVLAGFSKLLAESGVFPAAQAPNFINYINKLYSI